MATAVRRSPAPHAGGGEEEKKGKREGAADPSRRAGGRGRRVPAIVFPIDIIMTLIDAVFVIGAYVAVQVAFSAVAYVLGGMVVESYLGQLLDVPGFAYHMQGGREYGNATWAVYEQLRWVSYIGLGAVVVAAAVARFLDSGGMLPGGEGGGERGMGRSRSDKMLLRCAAIAVFLAAFPLVWDVAASAMEAGAMFVANPYYSQDEDWPCARVLYDNPEAWRRLYHGSPYIEPHAKALNAHPPDLLLPDGSFPSESSPPEAAGFEQLCDPNLKLAYVWDKITGVPEYELPEGLDPVEWIGLAASGGATEVFMFVFFGTLRALVVMQAALIAMLSLVMADLFTSMIIAAMPFLLVLGLVPQAKPTTDKLLLSLPGLYMVPLVAAVVIAVGAGAVADAGGSAMSAETIGPVSGAVIYMWFVALAVVFMAAGVPLMLVPLITSVMTHAQGVVSSAASTAAMVTGRTVMGGVKGFGGGGGVRGGMAGALGGGGSGVLSAGGVGGGGGGDGGDGGPGGGGSGLSGVFSSILGGGAAAGSTPGGSGSLLDQATGDGEEERAGSKGG